MKSLKCPRCNLVTHPNAEFCKQCGLNLKEPLPTVNNNLFICPDCQNPCSKNAPTCPSCGRIFPPAPVSFAQKPINLKGVVIALIIVFMVFALSGLTSEEFERKTDPELYAYKESIRRNQRQMDENDKKNSENNKKNSYDNKIPGDSAGRQMVVDGLSQMALESGKAVNYSNEGFEGRVLSIKSDDIASLDCLMFSMGEYGKLAASKGFNRVVCRNSKTGEDWSHALVP